MSAIILFTTGEADEIIVSVLKINKIFSYFFEYSYKYYTCVSKLTACMHSKRANEQTLKSELHFPFYLSVHAFVYVTLFLVFVLLPIYCGTHSF